MNFDKDIIKTNGGIFLVNKHKYWTSFDVVKKLKCTLKIRKVGHAGTLDPLAEGLLIVCCGKKTKEINQYMNLEKEYVGKILLGKTTPSYDLETEFSSSTEFSAERFDIPKLNNQAKKFVGTIIQQPPIFSSVKVDGKRLYKFARRGESVEIPKREVNISKFHITSYNYPEIEFIVNCSKGTYIRSLANDFGKLIGVGGCLSYLKRTKIGSYHLNDAYTIEDIIVYFNT